MDRNRDSEISYRQTDSLTLGDQWQFAADRDRVVFGRRDGQIELFQDDTREAITGPEPLEDIDVDRYLICLTDGVVSAYTVSEVELWTQTVPGATDVVSMGGKDVLAVLTEENDVIGLDLETGSELFSVSRPHDDFEDYCVAGGRGMLCIGAWSFFVCIDISGTVRIDQNLDSTIEGIAILDDLVVVGLKGGDIIGLDPQTGEQRWSNSASLRYLAPGGQKTVPALDDSGSILIHAEGRIEQLELDTGHRIIGATDGTVIGITEDTSATVYRIGSSPAEQLDIDVLTNQLEPAKPIRIRVGNDSNQPIETTVRLETAPPVHLESQYERLELSGGESCEIAFRLVELPETDEVECQVVVDENELTSAAMAVATQVDLEEAVRISSTCNQIENRVADFTITCENISSETLDEVRIDGETQVTDMKSGETVEVNQSYPLNDERQIITAQINHRNKRTTIEQEVTVPTSVLNVDIDRGGGDNPCIVVTAQPSVSAPISGELSVSIDEEKALTRDLSLASDETLSLVFVLPYHLATRETLPVSVDSPLLEAVQRAEISGWDGTDIESVLGQDRDNSRNESREEQQRSITDRTTDTSTQRWEQSQGPQETDQRSTPQTDRNRESQQASNSAIKNPDIKEGDQTDNERSPEFRNQQPRVDLQLNIEREIPDSVNIGERVAETIFIVNESRSQIESITISDSFAQTTLERIEPGRKRTVKRYHSFFETGEKQLPPLQVNSVKTDPLSLTVVESDITVEAEAVWDSERRELAAYFAIKNLGERRCVVQAVGIDISPTERGTVWTMDQPVRIEPNASETIKRTIEFSEKPQFNRNTRIAIIECQTEGTREKHRTLAPLTQRDQDSGVSWPSVTLTENSEILENSEGAIEIEVRNRGQTHFEDVTVSLEGEMVLETPLSEDTKSVSSLPPGETLTVGLADVLARSETTNFDVVISAVVDGTPRTHRLEFEGPVAQSVAEWTDKDYLNDWKYMEDGTKESVDIEAPHLTTPFQTRGEGSPR